MEKEDNEKKICLPSAYDLTLGKTSVCRVLDLEHSAIRLTGPHTRSSLWFKNEKKQNRLPSVRDLALDKAKVCRVQDHRHSVNPFCFFSFSNHKLLRVCGAIKRFA